MGFCLNRLCGSWQAGRARRLPSFRRGSWLGPRPRSPADHFSSGIINRVAGLSPDLVVGVDDLVSHRVVLSQLSLVGELARFVVFIECPEAELVIGPINLTAGETSGLIEPVMDFAHELAIF